MMTSLYQQLLRVSSSTKILLVATLFLLLAGFAIFHRGAEHGKTAQLVEAHSVQVGVNWNSRPQPTPTPTLTPHP